MSFAGRGFAVNSSPDGSLSASLGSGENLILSLPNNYKKYMLAIGIPVAVSNLEVEHILTWVDATDISIADNHEIPHRLSQYPNKLQEMRSLQRFAIAVSPNSYATLKINNFLEYLPSIQQIEVGAFPLSAEQIQEFINNQGTLSGWKVSLKNAGKTISFSRNN